MAGGTKNRGNICRVPERVVRRGRRLQLHAAATGCRASQCKVALETVICVIEKHVGSLDRQGEICHGKRETFREATTVGCVREEIEGATEKN